MSWFAVDTVLLAAALVPLVGFLVLIIFGRSLGREGSASGMIGTGFSFVSFSFAIAGLILWVLPDTFNHAHYVRAYTVRWITLSSGASVGGGILIDSLAVALFVMLTFIGVMAHLFALGSVPRRGQRVPVFYAQMQLLHFAMLGLLLSNSLVQIFAFLELLSIAGYFLLRSGVDATGMSARAQASAFRFWAMQAIGSAALLLGTGILYFQTHSLSRLGLLDQSGASILVEAVRQVIGVNSSEFLYFSGDGFLAMHWLTWCGICFLVAALARLAQFPLFHWVDSAAESPAPISSLLLGCFLPAAGIFLLARVFPIFTIDARFITAVVGCVTLAAGALVALVQNDIRRILAWSTVSQGGYILLFLGAGGYTAGVLHLFTHAFIKAALFLAAGAVIFRLETADIRQMGGMWRRFPITAAASLIAMFALAGVPWLSGSYSSSLGLACVYDYARALRAETGGHAMLLFWVPAVTTYLTAWGAGRWWWMIFAGESRNPKVFEKAAESGFLTLPILTLAGFSVGGWYEFSGIVSLIEKSIPAALGRPGATEFVIAEYPSYAHVLHIVGWAFLGLGVAVVFASEKSRIVRMARRVPGVSVVLYWLEERMFFQELFEEVLLSGLFFLARIVMFCERFLDAVAALLRFLFSLPVAVVGKLERPRLPDPPAPEPPATPDVSGT